MNSLYRYSQDFGRMGFLSGVFVADDADVTNAFGRGVVVYEMLGKHSESVIEISPDTVKRLDTTAEFVAEFERLFGDGFGTNPLYELEVVEDGDEYE